MTRDLTDDELRDAANEAKRDAEPDEVLVCEWCDFTIDPSDLSEDDCKDFGGTICKVCAKDYGQ